MSLDLSRIFAELDRAENGPSGPLMSAGRGSAGSLRSFRLPFIPEEVAAPDEDGGAGQGVDAPHPTANHAAAAAGSPYTLATGVWTTWPPAEFAD